MNALLPFVPLLTYTKYFTHNAQACSYSTTKLFIAMETESVRIFFFSARHCTFDRVSLIKVAHTCAVCSYCGRMRVPLSYHLYQSFWIPSFCFHVKNTVLIKMSFCTPERVATVELVWLLVRVPLCIKH